jgi:hypothetical protein
MPLTNPAVQADLYVALEEQAIRCIVETVMLQRPSLFNYATPGFIQHPELMYTHIAVHPAVQARNNPLITVLKQPLPVFGTRMFEEMNQPPPENGQEQPKLPDYYSLNYFAQVTSVQVDFSPGNVIAMPPELPALPDQHFAFRLAVAAGVGFPSAEMDLSRRPSTEILPALAPIQSVCKFPMEVVLTGYVSRSADVEKLLDIGVDGFEIVDLQPSGLECIIESYVKMEAQQVIIPQLLTYLRAELPGLILPIVMQQKPGSPVTLPHAVKVTLTPVSQVIPRNPAFQSDAVQTYAHLVEIVP